MKQIKGFLTFAAICAAIFTQQITSAGDGTYSGTHGNWSDTTRWTGGVVADGADSSATFVGTGSIHLVVTNNATRTIGNIVGNFNNSSYGTTILTNDLESPLILQTTIGSPPPMPKLIQKSGYLNIVAPIQGNQGIEITGVNNYVTLSSSNSTYTGGTLVSSGYLRVGASTELPLTKGPLGVGSLTLMNGTQFSSDGTSARDIHNNIILPGGTVTHGHGTYYGAQRLRGNILLQNDVTLIGSGEQQLEIHGKIIDNTDSHTITYSGARAVKLFNTTATYGGGTIINMANANNGIYLGANSTVDPLDSSISGPFGSGPVHFVYGTLTTDGATARTIDNPFFLEGDVAISFDTTHFGNMTFTSPWTLTGNRLLTSTDNTSQWNLFAAGFTDAGQNYRLDMRGDMRSIRVSGTNTLGGGIHLWDVNLVVMPESIWNTTITLQDSRSVLRLFNTQNSLTTTIAPVILDGGSAFLWPQGNQNQAGKDNWIIPSITRVNRATLTVSGYTSGSVYYGPQWSALGANDKIYVTQAPAVVNGMVAPYILEGSSDFLTYDGSGNGFKRAIYTHTNNLEANDPTGIHKVTSAQTLSGDAQLYALRTAASIDGNSKITIGSGGLITDGTLALDCDIDFGNAEGSLYNRGSGLTVTMNGSFYGNDGLIKWGNATLVLNNDNYYSGPTVIDSGVLKISSQKTAPLPAGSELILRGDAKVDLNGQNATIGNLVMKGGYIYNSSATTANITLGNRITVLPSPRVAMIAPDDVNRRLNMTLSGPTVIDVVGGNPDIDLRLGYGDVNSRYANISGNNTPITKRGAGTLFISGTNTFTGDTTIEGGTLITYINTNNNQPLGEAANIVLRRNGSLEARGSNGQTMTMLDLSFRGGNILGYNAGSSTVKISLSSLSRVSRGTLVLKGTAGNAYWSSNGYLLVDAWKNNGALNVNGMLPPFFVHAGYATDQGLGTFAYLETSTGRVRLLAAASGGWSLGKYHKTTVAAASATETVDMTATAELQSDKEIWALRTTADLTSDDTTLTLGSGGIICNANVTIEPKIVFGNGSTEAFIYVAGAYGKSPIRTATFTDTLTTTTGLTKFGGGRLALTADNSATLLGTHFVNEGILSLADGSVLASDSVLNLEIGTALELGDDTTLKALHGSGSVSGNGTLTVSTVLSPGFAGDINTLKVGSLAMSGTLNWDYRENESDLVECQDLAFNGSILVNASWLGDNAPLAGSFPLFSYTGSNPTVSGWGVKAPTGMQGDVTLDQVNKKVMLNLYPGAAGTIIFIR